MLQWEIYKVSLCKLIDEATPMQIKLYKYMKD